MKQPIQILLIEDDRDDIELFELTLVDNNIPYSLQVLNDGAEASNYFHTDNRLPHVIIMDFNLPKIHGREILKEYIQSKYAHIPLIVLTTSSAPEDRNYALKNGANDFFIKPSTRQGLTDTVNAIIEIAERSKKTSSFFKHIP